MKIKCLIIFLMIFLLISCSPIHKLDLASGKAEKIDKSMEYDVNEKIHAENNLTIHYPNITNHKD